MAILGPVFAFLGRFVGKILTTTLGWASTLLFGRVPQSRQVWLAALTFGSLVWVALLAGVLLPDVGTFLLAFVPLPDWVDEGLVRLAMLVAAIVLPAILGAVTLLVTDPAARPKGARGYIGAILRGYPLAPALAITLVVLAVAGIVRKARSILKRSEDAHVAMVVRPGRYDAVVRTVRDVLSAEDLVTEQRAGSRVLTVPAKLLARIAGAGVERLVPDELAELHGPELTASVYPSDLAMSGSKKAVARARALVARDVRSQDAWFTTTEEAQAVEDQLAELERAGGADATRLKDIDRRLLDLTISQEEWEVLYRRRLQVVAGDAGDLPARPSTSTGERALAGPSNAGEPPAFKLDLGSAIGLATSVLVVIDLVLARIGSKRRVRRL